MRVQTMRDRGSYPAGEFLRLCGLSPVHAPSDTERPGIVPCWGFSQTVQPVTGTCAFRHCEIGDRTLLGTFSYCAACHRYISVQTLRDRGSYPAGDFLRLCSLSPVHARSDTEIPGIVPCWGISVSQSCFLTGGDAVKLGIWALCGGKFVYSCTRSRPRIIHLRGCVSALEGTVHENSELCGRCICPRVWQRFSPSKHEVRHPRCVLRNNYCTVCVLV